MTLTEKILNTYHTICKVNPARLKTEADRKTYDTLMDIWIIAYQNYRYYA